MTDFVISEDWLQRMDNSPMLSVMQIRDLFAEARSRPLSDEKPCDHCDFNERDLQMAESIMKAKKAERVRVVKELQEWFSQPMQQLVNSLQVQEKLKSLQGEP